MAKASVVVPAVIAALLVSALLIATCIFYINPAYLRPWMLTESSRRRRYSDSEMGSSREKVYVPRTVPPVPIPRPGGPDDGDGHMVINVPDPEDDDAQVVEVHPDGTQIVEPRRARR